MHPKVAQAIQEIDVALCNGDTFDDPEARADLAAYLERWAKQLAPAAPAETEAWCPQCSSAVLGYHRCEGVPE